MSLKPKESMNEEELKSGLSYLTRDGVASQIMVTLTGGAFLIAFAVALGASNLVIGLLAAIVPLAQLIQLPSIFLVEKVRNRKVISLIAAGSSRLVWLLIAFIPFFFLGKSAIFLLLILLLLASSFSAVAGCGWNSWMSDLVPMNIRGVFFSKRMRLSLAFSVIVSVCASFFLDYWKTYFPHYEIEGYSILFIFGILVGFVGLYFISKIPEPLMIAKKEKDGIIKTILKPFKDENFRNLISFMCSWNFAVNLAGPFFIVYMLKRLGLSMSLIIALIILSQMMNFVFLRAWGKFTDRFSNKSVLAISGPLFIFSILAWTFTTLPEKHIFTIPLLVLIHLVMGMASAGVSLASSNISLKLAPKGEATSYLAANTFANSLAAGIAPILGGLSADFFAGRELAWTLSYTTPSKIITLPTLNLQQWDFFFFFAFLIGLYSLHRLVAIREEGEVEEKIVAREMFAEVRNQTRILSAVEGVKHMVNFPSFIFQNIKNIKLKKPKKNLKL